MRSTTSRTLRVVASTLVAALIVLGAPACSGGGASAKGTKLTIPVLWAGTDGSGNPAGGVERASVTVAQLGAPGFGLDLSSVEAKKAGPQWMAASTTAAAVATLLSSADPSTIDIKYTVESNIDGPSGGAVLTVATLAAIRGATLDPKVTMTGTISPDGTVGAISGVPLKLRGAAKAGYRKVLLPMDNLTSSGDAQTSDMIELGRTLGLEVIGVKDVSEAYGQFTGSWITPEFAPDERLSDPVALAAATTTQRLINRLQAELSPSTSGGAKRATLLDETNRALTALAAGQTATAYAIAQDAYTLMSRANGAAPYIALGNAYASQQQVQSALTRLQGDAKDLLARTSARIIAESDVTGLDAVDQMSLPFAMGWSTYGEAVLKGLLPLLESGEISANAFADVGSVIGEQRAALEVFDVDAIEMAKSARNTAAVITTGATPVTFLSQYTNFLNRSADANLTYYRTVVKRGTPQDIDGNGNPNYQWLAASAYKDESLRTPLDEQEISLEVQQAARAVTYFVLGASLVADSQALGIQGSGIGADPIKTTRPSLLANSIDIASQNVVNQTAALRQRNIDVTPALWSAQWGRASAQNLTDTSRAVAGSVIALNELWYDVMWVSALRAAFGQ